MIVITQEQLDDVLSEYDVATAIGNKVGAIKKLRKYTGLGLKETLHIVESGCTEVAFNTYHVHMQRDTPEYYIDRMFELSHEIAICVEKLREFGITPRSK